MLFDARAAKLLKPGEHIVFEGCLGLRLVASESRRTWVYRYKNPSGLMKQVSIGQWPLVSASEAVSKWQALRNARAEGVDPRKPKKIESAVSVRQVVEAYIDGHIARTRKPDGAAAAERALREFLSAWPVIARGPASELSRADAFAVLDAMRDRPTSAVKLRSMLGGAWELAHDSGALGQDVPNWWRSLMLGKLKTKGKVIGGEHQGPVRRVLSLNEVRELLAWSDANMHDLGRDALVMYLWTCARGSEILAMRPERLRKDGGVLWWIVPASMTKNAGKPNAIDHRVPLFGRALKVVERRLKAVGESGWLFEDRRGRQYTQHFFSTYVYGLQPYSVKVKNRQSTGGLVCPVAGWSPHDLRRTGRSLLASIGCPQEVAEAILGHMPSGIVGTYNRHSYDSERVEWLDRLSQLLSAPT